MSSVKGANRMVQIKRSVSLSGSWLPRDIHHLYRVFVGSLFVGCYSSNPSQGLFFNPSLHLTVMLAALHRVHIISYTTAQHPSADGLTLSSETICCSGQPTPSLRRLQHMRPCATGGSPTKISHNASSHAPTHAATHASTHPQGCSPCGSAPAAAPATATNGPPAPEVPPLSPAPRLSSRRSAGPRTICTTIVS